MGCSVLTFTEAVVPGTNTVESQVALAFVLLAVGLFTSWLAYYLYNRLQARRLADGKFRNDSAWQSEVELPGGKKAGRSAFGEC